MSDHEIEQIELSIQQAEEIVKKGLLAERLAQNPTFKKVILDGYFVEEAARLSHLLYDHNMSADQKEMIKVDLAGPAALKRYLMTMVQMGKQAQGQIDSDREAMDEIRMEDAEDSGEEL